MSYCFNAEEVVKEKFLFVSYSHAVIELVDKTCQGLIENGVRIFYDKTLTAGDEWASLVENLLRHENCCGAILFLDISAILSPNVAKERKIIADEVKKRPDYLAFIVNVSQNNARVSYMQLLKQAFDRLDEISIDRIFPLNALMDLMFFIGNDPISLNSHEENLTNSLLEAIRLKIPHVIDENFIVLKELGEHPIHLGIWNEKAVAWKFLYSEGGKAVFLSGSVLDRTTAGKALDEWLTEIFQKRCFTPDQAALLKGNVRLLTAEEAKAVDRSTLCASDDWWLFDRDGALQKTIRKDGSLYDRGFHNRNCESGIRPCISISIENVKKLVSK